ncbi:hypothetical protein DFH06DRAFT_1119089 [Mycena polygramma]|nr:hypothetical protein DFH06DRAFT_1119089 [Mycena polygramma]
MSNKLSYILDEALDLPIACSTSFQVREVDSSAHRTRYPPAINTTAAQPGLSLTDLVKTDGPTIVGVSHIYWCSLFAYHIVLLRLPTTFHSLASDAFFLQRSDTRELELWDSFTEILLKQWKTLGLFSTLIFGATLTMFQIPSITGNSLLRALAHFTLLCVTMSLIYTSLLSVFFGSWRSEDTAAKWIQEMRGANPYNFRNFWILISLPAVWTCWGIFFFLASMVLFVWPLGPNDPSHGGETASLGMRIFLMMVVVAGGIHLALAILTLRRLGQQDSLIPWVIRIDKRFPQFPAFLNFLLAGWVPMGP